MNINQQYFSPNQEARRSLAAKLGLDFDDSMQDWEYEVADQYRIEEFIAEYDKGATTDKEKESLMELILDSSNNLLLNGNMDEFERIFPEIQSRLKSNPNLHKGTLRYWTTNGFLISERLKN